jgi:hypothetical protein
LRLLSKELEIAKTHMPMSKEVNNNSFSLSGQSWQGGFLRGSK